ncbi:MAG: Ribosomal large subunit pseudouridine synthase D [Holosporales bacterium]
MQHLLTVEPHHHGQRLDLFLSQNLHEVTRNQVQLWIEQGAIMRDNQRIEKASLKVQTHQTYVINIPDPIEAIPQPTPMDLTILYEDTDLLVLNKQAGLVVHPGAGHYQDTLVNGLLHHCTDLSGIGGVLRPGIVHRLDKDTSGLMVVAKNDKTHHDLSRQFQEKGSDQGVIRQYIGFCWHVPYPKSGRIQTQIARDFKDRQRMANVLSNGKEAISDYLVLQAYESNFSKIQFTLLTGRTHQIRLHCQHIKHPLIGDSLYGTRLSPAKTKNLSPEILAFPRQALHAFVLEFTHPSTRDRLRFCIDLPQDLKDLEAAL